MLFQILFAQNSDCINAVQICSGANLTTNPSGSGSVDVVNYGCLAGESSSAWYILNISTNGVLTFTINPAGRTDYDFALWGPFNTVNCNTLGSPIRCSFADPSNCNNGVRYNTGIRTTDSDLSENGSAICNFGGSLTGLVNGFTNSVNVLGGERYILLVNNYDNNSRSFTLSFPSMTAGLSCPTLPIIFNFINGYSKNENNLIEASIAYSENINEIVTYKFDSTWVKIHNTNIIKDFTIVDKPNVNKTLYKIESINFDGKIETSNIIEIINDNFDNILLNPNPFDNIIEISKESVNYEIFSIDGKSLLIGTGSKVNLEYLSGGMYFIKINNKFYKINKN